jgi:ribonuclease P protein component
MAAPSTPGLGLPRAARLLRPSEFAQARRLGGRAWRGCLIANWLPQPAGVRSRLGVVTSRKVGSAVVRNRARRLLRDVFRHHQHALAGPLDLVLVARPSIAGKPRAQVERDFLALLRSHALIPPPA